MFKCIYKTNKLSAEGKILVNKKVVIVSDNHFYHIPRKDITRAIFRPALF